MMSVLTVTLLSVECGMHVFNEADLNSSIINIWMEKNLDALQ